MTANTPSSRKAKGRKFQQWVADRIGKVLHIPVGKDKDIESREMGQSGVDIKLYGEAKKKFRYSVEVKRQENLSIPAWIKQAKTNQEKGTDWLLFSKRNQEDPIVIMDADAFFSLIKKAIKGK